MNTLGLQSAGSQSAGSESIAALETALNLEDRDRVQWHLTTAALIEQSLRHSEVILTSTGGIAAYTGKFTGRTPDNRFIVRDATTENMVDWGKVNQPIGPESFDRVLQRCVDYGRVHPLFVQDCFVGADPDYRLPVRVITELAWHALFARQLFIRTGAVELSRFHPDFTVVALPGCEANPATDGTRSGTFILLNFERQMILIGGTHYAGEIKKSVFSALNFLLPQRGVMPMHCSANIGAAGDVALFFGLSGTGKTTLSSDPARRLIGDDEHGWTSSGVFNFEGGCYAKCIRLSREGEPQIWNAIRFGTVLENVAVDKRTRDVDFDDDSITENTRAAYPINYIPGAVMPSVGPHPRNLLFLTADAFGVLPPVARLSVPQAMYHFLSGYTAKIAGTEAGVREPQATFSNCFGAPFLPLSPLVYARMLGERIDRHHATCWLVNTGWTGGGYGVGSRIKLAYTRAIVEAVLNGSLNKAAYRKDPVFNLDVPQSVAGIPDKLLMPQSNWPNESDYFAAARELAARFHKNFEKFGEVSDQIRSAGPQG